MTPRVHRGHVHNLGAERFEQLPGGAPDLTRPDADERQTIERSDHARRSVPSSATSLAWSRGSERGIIIR